MAIPVNFLTLKQRAARQLRLLDNDDQTFLQNKDITESQLGEMINEAYLETVYPKFQLKYPEFYERLAVSPNYRVTGVVSGTSTGSTLVTTTPIFFDYMQSSYIENVDLSVSLKINAVTDASTVTVDGDVTEWNGDAIRIIDQVLTFQGDATDLYAVKRVEVRYSNSQRYKIAKPLLRRHAIQTNYETFSEYRPVYFHTTLVEEGEKRQAIEIRPFFTRSDNEAIRLRYQEVPQEMVNGADVPMLPLGHQNFLYWAAVREVAFIRGERQKEALADSRFQTGLNNLIRTFHLMHFDRPLRFRMSRRIMGAANSYY